MNKYEILPPYKNESPKTPQPEHPETAIVLTVRDGINVIYSEDTIPTCGIRLIHPTNPKTPAARISVSLLYVPPASEMALHNHEAEEVYVIQSGTGTMFTEEGDITVSPGDYIYMSPWARHGIRNTGREMLTVLLATTPPNP